MNVRRKLSSEVRYFTEIKSERDIFLEAAPCIRLCRRLFRKTGRQSCLGTYQYLHVRVLFGSRGLAEDREVDSTCRGLRSTLSFLLHLSKDFILSTACSGNSRMMLDDFVVRFRHMFVREFKSCKISPEGYNEIISFQFYRSHVKIFVVYILYLFCLFLLFLYIIFL